MSKKVILCTERSLYTQPVLAGGVAGELFKEAVKIRRIGKVVGIRYIADGIRAADQASFYFR